MMSMKPEHLHLAGAVAERHAGLKLVIDHLALPDGQKGDAAFAELDKLLVLARLPNVAAKASAVTSFASDEFPYRSLHPHLRRVYDAFGPKRMFWGTDLTRRECTYGQAIALFAQELPWLSGEDKAWVMGRGVCEWLGWPVPAAD
jgi:L-fuconolactonase